MRLESLARQATQLQTEINEFVRAALDGQIPVERLTFAANKIYKKDGNETAEFNGAIGETFAALADINCRLWHEQEKVYDFENVAPDRKNAVIKQLAILNLERNKCIDQIDRTFQTGVTATVK